MRRRLLRKPFVIAGVVVVVAAAAGAFVMTRGAAGNVSYRTAAATLGTVTQTVSLTGNLAPDGENDLDFQGAGAVAKNPIPPTEANLMAGLKIFEGDCAGCHGTPLSASANEAKHSRRRVKG